MNDEKKPSNPHAFPLPLIKSDAGTVSNSGYYFPYDSGMTLRDWFAGQCQEDDRLVKCIRAMDDRSLELFAQHYELEREEHITALEFTDYSMLDTEVRKIARRLELEAKAIARVRFMQADAMLKEREKEAQ